MVRTQQGTILGSYRILRQLGKGGEGSVYLCTHLRTGQYWALKILEGKWASGRHEMEMMKRLSHPGLPRIIDIFETILPEDVSNRKTVVLVMEYIQGKTLEELVRGDRALTKAQAEDAASQLSELLVYLHGRRAPICHLDLKPSNLILTDRGRIYLTDFGSAVFQGKGTRIPRKGTDGYAAPEQYDPKRLIDERTDVYGFGAVLYRLISGKKYTSMMLKSRIPGCDPAMEKILRKCLQPQPEARYQTAQQLSRDLKKLQRSRQSERTRIRLWASVWLSILALYVAAVGIGTQLRNQSVREKEYHAIMQESLSAPERELEDLYREAVYREPARKEAWLSFIGWKDRDGVLSQEEDVQVRTLLHTLPLGSSETYEELLEKNALAYGEVACALGVLYWYDYADAGAKRIAQGWFIKACDAASKIPAAKLSAMKASASEPTGKSGKPPEGTTFGEMSAGMQSHTADWEQIARLYAHIGTYYDSFRETGGARNGEESALAYWQDTGELLETGEMEIFDDRKRLLLYESCVNRIIMDAGKLCTLGVTAQEMQTRIDQLREKLDGLEAVAPEEKEHIRVSLEEAQKLLSSLK